MANTIARQVLFDGTRKHIERLTIIGDGSGEETATLFNAVSGNCGLTTKLVKIQATLSGFSARLLWDASTPVFFQQIPSDKDIEADYYEFGGIINNAGTGVTGDIKFTTQGLGNGDSGSIVLTIMKF